MWVLLLLFSSYVLSVCAWSSSFFPSGNQWYGIFYSIFMDFFSYIGEQISSFEIN